MVIAYVTFNILVRSLIPALCNSCNVVSNFLIVQTSWCIQCFKFGNFPFIPVFSSYRFGDEGSIRLLVITLTLVLGLLYHYTKKLCGSRIYSNCILPLFLVCHPFKRYRKLLSLYVLASNKYMFIQQLMAYVSRSMKQLDWASMYYRYDVYTT